MTFVASRRAAEADLEQEHVGRLFGKDQQGCCGRDLEHGDRLARIHRLAAAERSTSRSSSTKRPPPNPAEPDALVEAHEMRRGVDVDGEPRALQDRPHEGDGRALAVGARHMDHRRQAAARDGRARRAAAGYARARDRWSSDAGRESARSAHRRIPLALLKACRRCSAASAIRTSHGDRRLRRRGAHRRAPSLQVVPTRPCRPCRAP